MIKLSVQLGSEPTGYSSKATFSDAAKKALDTKADRRYIMEQILSGNETITALDGSKFRKGKRKKKARRTVQYIIPDKEPTPEPKWKFKNWILPFSVTWGSASWLYGGSVTGSSWWTANDDETKQVESLCILGFCFEKEIGDLK